MREILFRGKTAYEEDWKEGWYGENCFGSWPLRPAIAPFDEARNGHLHYEEIIPDTVGQYTGLTDKNGKKIFEGDIVLGRFEFGMKVPSLVVFRYGAFGLEWVHAGKTVFTAFTGFCNVDFEVIGNVFDNPELLNKEA